MLSLVAAVAVVLFIHIRNRITGGPQLFLQISYQHSTEANNSRKKKEKSHNHSNMHSNSRHHNV
jgi:hypothetical protein